MNECAINVIRHLIQDSLQSLDTVIGEMFPEPGGLASGRQSTGKESDLKFLGVRRGVLTRERAEDNGGLCGVQRMR